MRRFIDGEGRVWDVFVGRASWGSLLALFAPIGRDEPVRQAPLAADSLDGAHARLAALDETALAELLDRSTRKED